MISDSITNVSIPIASSSPNDFAKKRRANRSAKLKQFKLDARREQWLSQVKSKVGCEEELKCKDGTHRMPSKGLENEDFRPTEKLEIKYFGGDVDNYGDGPLIHLYSESESSPFSVGEIIHSGTNFTPSSRSYTSSSSSRSSSSNECFSQIMSEEDDQDVSDDGCLDDWEAVADALDDATATDKKQHVMNSPYAETDSPDLVNRGGDIPKSAHHSQITKKVIDVPNSDNGSGGTALQRPANTRAWRADDALRPRCLPSLVKQYSFPLNSEQRFVFGGSVWGCKSVGFVPMACPICCEDLDCTDWDFLPCLCGFRICLFCHKRVMEEDGRCPGCRKLYDLID